MRPACLLLLSVGLAGCSAEETIPRVAVSGEVKVQGVLLEEGTINFRPEPGTPGPSASARVEGGEYEISREAGPGPGAYQITVIRTGSENAAPAQASPATARGTEAQAPKPGQPRLPQLPEKFTRTIQIEAAPSQTFDFDFSAKTE